MTVIKQRVFPINFIHPMALFGILFILFLLLIGAKVSGEEPSSWQLMYEYEAPREFSVSMQSGETGKTINIIHGAEYDVEFDGLRQVSKRGIAGLKKEKKEDEYIDEVPGKFKRVFSITRNTPYSVTFKTVLHTFAPMKYAETHYINSKLIAGRQFSLDNKPERAIVEKESHANNADRFKVGSKDKETSRFKKIIFHTEIGDVQMSFIQRKGIVDFRKIHWSQARSHIILNFPAELLEAGTVYEEAMTVSIKPNSDGLRAYKEIVSGWYMPQKEEHDRLKIIAPAPKEISWGMEHFPVKNELICRHNIDDRRILEYLRDKILSYGVSVKFLRLSGNLKEKVMFLSDASEFEDVKVLTEFRRKLDTIVNQEKYSLQVSGQGVSMVAGTEQGVWCGLQTLLQILHHQWGEPDIVLPTVNIYDWPDTIKRECMVRIGANADFALLKQYVGNVLQWKFNAILIEFNYGIDIESIPELNIGSGISKATKEKDLKDFIDYCRKYPIELIPLWHGGKLLDSVSMEHVKKYPVLFEIALRNPRFQQGKIVNNYDISLDKSFEFNRKVCDYFIDLCGASKIHIGMDEIYDFTKYTKDQSGRGDLILANYVNKFSNYYAPKDISIILYHDMLIKFSQVTGAGYFPSNAVGGSENALTLLENKDHLQINYWDYTENKSFPAISYLMDNGMYISSVMTWFREDNIKHLPKDAAVRGVPRATAAIWCRMERDPRRIWQLIGTHRGTHSFPTETFLPAVHFSAEKFWNTTVDRHNYNVFKEILLQYDGRAGIAPVQQLQIPLSLDKNANIFLPSKENSFHIGDTVRPGFVRPPSGKVEFGGIIFGIPAKGQKTGCVSVIGPAFEGHPPQIDIEFDAGDSIGKLIFLHSAIIDNKLAPGSNLGIEYIVNYSDATCQKIPLKLDENIMCHYPPIRRLSVDNTDLWCAWVGDTNTEYPATIYAFEWINPSPGKIIKSITVKSELKSKGDILLFAITAVKKQ